VASGQVVATVAVGTSPQAVSYDKFNAKLYVANSGSDNVSVIDSTNTVVATLPAYYTPTSLVWTENNGQTLVANNDGSNVMIYTDSMNPGVAERMRPGVCYSTPRATVVRGILFLPVAQSHKPQAASLLNAAGRKVRDLHTGANDVSTLAPGVYFVRESQAQAQAVHKLVLAR